MLAKLAGKVKCLNPNTGSRMNIDADTYELFSKAIYHTLTGSKGLTFTQLVEGIEDCFQKQQTKFNGSVGWYAVTVKNDMQAKGLISVVTEQGKKIHQLSGKQRAASKTRL